jgi:TPR repeat protein
MIGVLRAVHLPVPFALQHRAREREIELLTARAKAGDAKAQFELWDALSGTPDSWKGEQWLKRSAELGYAEAEREMGDRAEAADEHKLAVDWYRKAALQGDGSANTAMGFAYLTGEGVPLDVSKAAQFLEAGAERGDAFAAEELGGCYRRAGDCLLSADFNAACKWLFIARALGNGPTCDADVQSHLSPFQILEARQRAENFLRLYGHLYHLNVKRSDWATSP